MSLRSKISDPQLVLSLAPEELAGPLLSAPPSRAQPGQGAFHRDQTAPLAGEYPQQFQGAIELAIAEV